MPDGRDTSSESMGELVQPQGPSGAPSSDLVVHGPRLQPQQRILLYPAAEWESFIEEWAFFSLKPRYAQVSRFCGPGDRGIDIAGFFDDDGLWGVWDNYQCKHYNHPLAPSDIWPELAKVLWHSFSKAYRPPRRYYFTAPQGVGTTVNSYLNDSAKLKRELIGHWDKAKTINITKATAIPLVGEFRDYVSNFDFRAFKAKTGLELVVDHSGCPFHAVRFGGGLPHRPAAAPPPSAIAPTESRYVAQLLLAYADHKRKPLGRVEDLKEWPSLASHFNRQREAFYHAESLRVFARDSVPPGTFEALQEDIFVGVVDTGDGEHADGYARVCAVTKAARELHLTANALLGAAKPHDRDGMCHQLANDDRLLWVKDQA